MAKLVKLSVFLNNEFLEGHAPSKKTIRRLIDIQEIPGKRIGRDYYVDMQKFNLTGNARIDTVLLAS